MIFTERFTVQHRHKLHIARIVIAAAIALFINHTFALPHSSWSLITIIVVMGPMSYLGSVLTKANQRLIGTMIGASIGLALYLLPDEYIVLHDLFLLLILALAMCGANGKYSYATLLVALTLFLVAGAGSGNFEVAEWRAIHVIWGSLLSIVCSRLLFPSRALIYFQLLVVEQLQLCSDYYLIHCKCLNKCPKTTDYNLKLLTTNLGRQLSLMPHIQKEWKGNNQDIADIIIMERRVISVLETLITRDWQSQQANQTITDNPQLTEATHLLFEQMNLLSKQVDNGDVSPLLLDDIPLLTITTESFDMIDGHENTKSFNFFGYLWLNHELAKHVSTISFSLSKVFQHKNFK